MVLSRKKHYRLQPNLDLCDGKKNKKDSLELLSLIWDKIKTRFEKSLV